MPEYRVSLFGSQKSFAVAPGETVLAASRRAGLALPYSCLGGNCGSCRARVMAGRVDYPFRPPRALSAAERARGDALLCQAVALSDLSISIREIEAIAAYRPRFFTCEIREQQLLARDVMQVDLQPLGARVPYLAGQYLDIVLPGGKRRAFSIANAPHSAPGFTLHVRKVPGGGFTEALFARSHVGELLRVHGPLGTFVAREKSDRPLLLVAGGTGFAPIKALFEDFVRQAPQREIHVYWGARVAADLYLHESAAQWAERHAPVRYVPVLSEESVPWARAGWLHEVVLADHPELQDYDLYMAGPPALIEAGRRAFVDAGLPGDRLYYDSFEFAPDVLAQLLLAQHRIGP